MTKSKEIKVICTECRKRCKHDSVSKGRDPNRSPVSYISCKPYCYKCFCKIKHWHKDTVMREERMLAQGMIDKGEGRFV